MSFRFFLSWILLVVLFTGCDEDEERHPSIKTVSITPLSAANFLLKGSIAEVGSIPVIEYGFVYSLGGTPGVEYGSKIVLGDDPAKGLFEHEVVLPSQSGYYGGSIYIRAFITNERGTAYGSVVSVQIPELKVSSVSPLVASPGEQITIFGQNFGSVPSLNTVYFNETPATVVRSTSTSMDIIVPTGINYGYYGSYIYVSVRTGGQQVTATQYFVLKPSVSGFAPTKGTFGTYVTINGTFYTSGYYNSNFSVSVGGVTASISSMSSSAISFTIPNDLNQGTSKITLNFLAHQVDVGTFTMDPLVVSSVSCSEVFGNSYVTITGSGFNPWYSYYTSYNTIALNGQNVPLSSASSTQISFYVPTNLSTGSYSVSVGNSLETVVLPDQLIIDKLEVTGLSTTTIKRGNRFEIYGDFAACGFNFSPSISLSGYTLYVTKVTDTHLEVEAPTWLPVGAFQLLMYANNETIIVANQIQITD